VVSALGRLVGFPLLLVVLLLLPPGPASAVVTPEARTEVQRIEDYLNGLGNVRARVVQINPDGKTVTGTLHLSRPDRLRLAYDLPSRVLIVANGSQLVYYDPQLNQLSYLRVSSTPLGFLLADRVRLGGNVTVTDLARAGGELRVTLARADDPGAGRITLQFSESPLELRGWTVTDPQGLTTYVILEELERNVAMRDDLFRFMDPKIFGDPRR
jgi:outer membrane lipoprotein-sorting protein